MFRSTRILAGTALAGALVLAAAAPAMAQDCFNASRSGQGNVSAAAHSANWYSVGEFLQVVNETAPLGLTDAQIAHAVDVIKADSRVPANFTVFYNTAHPGELASKMKENLATNGKGIDHSDDYGTPILDIVVGDLFASLSS
jgi:hypothetical protein